MSKAYTPPARWLRRVAARMVVVFGALLVVLTVILRTELAEERHTTPAMQARYQRLAALLAAHHDQELVARESDAVILCLDERGSSSSWRLEFQRFALPDLQWLAGYAED